VGAATVGKKGSGGWGWQLVVVEGGGKAGSKAQQRQHQGMATKELLWHGENASVVAVSVGGG